MSGSDYRESKRGKYSEVPLNRRLCLTPQDDLDGFGYSGCGSL